RRRWRSASARGRPPPPEAQRLGLAGPPVRVRPERDTWRAPPRARPVAAALPPPGVLPASGAITGRAADVFFPGRPGVAAWAAGGFCALVASLGAVRASPLGRALSPPSA